MAPTKPPPWLLVASVVVFAITLAFMMLLAMLATVGNKQVPSDSRFLVVIVLALGAGFGAAGMGGTAAARGSIPIPGSQNHPVAVSVTGGIAVMIVVLLLRDVIVPPGQTGPDLTLDSLSGVVTSATPPRVMVTATFDGFSVSPGRRVLLALCADASCRRVLRADRIDDPRHGTMTVFVSSPQATVQAGYLVLEGGADRRTGGPLSISW